MLFEIAFTQFSVDMSLSNARSNGTCRSFEIQTQNIPNTSIDISPKTSVVLRIETFAIITKVSFAKMKNIPRKFIREQEKKKQSNL